MTIHEILTQLNQDIADATASKQPTKRCSSWAELLQCEDFDAQAETSGTAPDIQNEGI